MSTRIIYTNVETNNRMATGSIMASINDIKDIVYTLLQLIPPGKVVSYGELAKIIGTSPRVIGKVLKLNDKPIIIPCHRVVKNNGELGGYSFGGSRVKRRLLEIEGVVFDEKGRIRREFFYDLSRILNDP
jgi:methylated-DNA-[protein]-cysteine S-methyltransferase